MKVLLFSLGSCFTLTQSDSPITKVVNLLKELEARIDADEAVESNVYKKYACWCETTSKRKADAIAKGREDIKLFGTKVLELKAEVARLGKLIQDKKKDLADEERSLAQMTALRKKNNQAFLALKAEMEHAIEGLDKAIKVLAGAGTTAKQVLLQSPEFVSFYHLGFERQEGFIVLLSKRRHLCQASFLVREILLLVLNQLPKPSNFCFQF
jgi:DNA gyrase/topoisomerase IV subunit A